EATTINFTRGSHEPSEDQIDKIKALVDTDTQAELAKPRPNQDKKPLIINLRKKNLDIRGYISEDEPAEVALARAKHVAEVLQGWGHEGSRNVLADSTAGKGNFMYYGMRIVEILEAGKPSRVDTGATAKCDDKVFEGARSDAAKMVERAIDQM